MLSAKISACGCVALLSICGAAALAQPIRLSARELSLQTNRWDGKQIEVRLRCLFADQSDYRCVGRGVRVDLKTITNHSAREQLEKDCRTLADSVRRRCLFTVRFIYDGNRRTAGTGDLTIVDAQNGQGEIVMSRRGH